MENIQTAPERTQFSLWMQAVRPFSFTASLIPILIGMALAITNPVSVINWALFPIVLIGGILLQAGTNLVSEYYDLQKGVDRTDTLGSSRVLVDGLMEPQKVLRAGMLCFVVTFLMGMVLVMERGLPIFILGIVGILGGMFYTGKPIGYKYLALGDILVFFLMGPLMVIGSYFSLTGLFSWDIFQISIPIGLLVTAIMHANNIRDIKDDTKANAKTMASVLGIKTAKIYYFALELAAYLTILSLYLIGTLEVWTLIVFISIIPAIANMKEIAKAEVENPEKVMMIDVKTAQHHLLFGVLLIVGLILSKYF